MRTHIQFSGSLQPEDAAPIVKLLREAIERRPPKCGAVFRVQNFTDEHEDISKYDHNGLTFSISEIVKAMEP